MPSSTVNLDGWAKNLKVKVLLFAALKELIGKGRLDLTFDRDLTLKDLMMDLSERYGKKFYNYLFDEYGRFRGYIRFFINEEPVKTSEIGEINLKDGDVVAIIPPVSGG
ncbi:molybdopterin synthase sulfur carrier subunit [Candidatus Bathyarchaeota archaeon B24-2]|nr:MAG: molybdopterin synthase sulfur carrier subunit [Candidatus Bathyarchaeota archaeon B24-2]